MKNQAKSRATRQVNRMALRQSINKALQSCLLATLILLPSTASSRPTQIPISVAYAVKPNVMILIDNSGSMLEAEDPTAISPISRMNAAKNAVSEVFENTQNVRFCLSTFNNAFDFVEGKDGIVLPAYNGFGGFMNENMQCSDDIGDSTDVSTLLGMVNDFSDDAVIQANPNASSPFGSALYDITRYFRGKDAFFGQFDTGALSDFAHPIELRCQPNSTVIVTHAEPQDDWRGPPDSDTADPYDLQDLSFISTEASTIDGVEKSLTKETYNNNDGDWDNEADPVITIPVEGVPVEGEETLAIIDDVALFSTEIDFVPNSTTQPNHYTSRAIDSEGGSFDDPLFKQQKMNVHVVGFQNNDPLLAKTAVAGNGIYALANDQAELIDAIGFAARSSTTNSNATGAGAAQSSVGLDKDGQTNLFITRYSTENWTGDLERIIFKEKLVDGEYEADPVLDWSAATKLDALATPVTTRKIFTNTLTLTSGDGTHTPVEFLYNNLNANEKTLLRGTHAEVYGDAIVNYVRGLSKADTDASLGLPADEQTIEFRSRDSRLGDLVHSRATYVKNPNFGYIDDAASVADQYKTYVNSNNDSYVELNGGNARDAMIYVGGNDGMLHAFNADDGREVFAYVPRTILDGFVNYVSAGYIDNHQYLVDGEMSVVDARINDDWGTFLVSPLGAGYRGMFMLDITDPSPVYSNLFKWEINEKTTDSDGDLPYSSMGYILNPPKIVRFAIPDSSTAGFTEKWVVLSGNGVHSEDAVDLDPDGNPIKGKASIFVIDFETGELLHEIVLDTGRDVNDINGNGNVNEALYDNFGQSNGVTSISAVDSNGNTYIDRLYAADLKGQLWRIDFDSNASSAAPKAYIKSNLTVATVGGVAESDKKPIFSAKGPIRKTNADSVEDSNLESTAYADFIPQAITSEITVVRGPNVGGSTPGEMVFFGTGQYFDIEHRLVDNNLSVQSMYAFVDKGKWEDVGRETLTRNDLDEQEISLNADDERIFTHTDSTASSVAKIDYLNGGLGWFMDLPDYGERIIRKSVGLFEHMAFYSLEPLETAQCSIGDEGWAMIAKRDQATAIVVNGDTSSPGGIKRTSDTLKDPVFVEFSDGKLLAPGIKSDGTDVTLEEEFLIQKDYSRNAWQKL